MRISWRVELPQVLLLVGLFVAAATSWPEVPEQIPVHWGFSGAVDRYGGRLEGLFALPLLALALYVLLLLLPRIDPGRANYASFKGAYGAIRLAVLVAIAAADVTVLLAARGYPVEVSRAMTLATGAVLLVVGNYLGKIRPNWFIGVRTPWTLSSRQSWTKTHRLGRWIFVAAGLLLIGGALTGSPAVSGSAFAVLIGGTIWLAVYSYRIWRTDPERISPAATSPALDADPFH
jgi:uncharacterized membrane protein